MGGEMSFPGGGGQDRGKYLVCGQAGSAME